MAEAKKVEEFHCEEHDFVSEIDNFCPYCKIAELEYDLQHQIRRKEAVNREADKWRARAIAHRHSAVGCNKRNEELEARIKELEGL